MSQTCHRRVYESVSVHLCVCVSYLYIGIDSLVDDPFGSRLIGLIVADCVVRRRLSRDGLDTVIMCLNVQPFHSSELQSLQPIRRCGLASSSCYVHF